MDCRAFEELIVELDPASGVKLENRQARDHLLTCTRCQELLQTLLTEAPPAPVGLAREILLKTSGPACGQASHLLCDYVDGALPRVQNELIRLHVAECPACLELSRTLTMMREELPLLAEIHPAPGFADRVLRAVEEINSNQPRWFGKVGEWMAGLLQRPRFSLEAAYLGTLLMVMLVGNPFASLPDKAPQLMASLTNQKAGVVQVLERGSSEVETRLRVVRTGIGQTVNRLTAVGGKFEKAESELERKADVYYGRVRTNLQTANESFKRMLNGAGREKTPSANQHQPERKNTN